MRGWPLRVTAAASLPRAGVLSEKAHPHRPPLADRCEGLGDVPARRFGLLPAGKGGPRYRDPAPELLPTSDLCHARRLLVMQSEPRQQLQSAPALPLTARNLKTT